MMRAPDVALALSCVDLGDKGVTFADTAIHALAAQHADFNLRHVQPTGVFKGLMKYQALKCQMDNAKPGRGNLPAFGGRGRNTTRVAWPSHLASIMARMRAVSASMAKGLVSTCIPGSR